MKSIDIYAIEYSSYNEISNTWTFDVPKLFYKYDNARIYCEQYGRRIPSAKYPELLYFVSFDSNYTEYTAHKLMLLTGLKMYPVDKNRDLYVVGCAFRDLEGGGMCYELQKTVYLTYESARSFCESRSIDSSEAGVPMKFIGKNVDLEEVFYIYKLNLDDYEEEESDEKL